MRKTKAKKEKSLITKADRIHFKLLQKKSKRISDFSSKELLGIISDIKKGNKNSEKELILAYLGICASFAWNLKQVHISHLSVKQLVEEGKHGLLKSAKSADRKWTADKIVTRSIWWIQQAMLKAIQENKKKAKVKQ